MAKEKQFILEDITTHSLFVPRGKGGLVIDYPELKKNKYLSGIRNDKLLFCWFLGCEGSPCYDYYNSDNPSDKRKALDFAKKHSEIRVNDSEWKRVLEELNTPPEYIKGIKEFNSFKVGPRVRMMRMVEHMLNNFEKIISIDVNGSEFNMTDKDGRDLGEKDYVKIKQYTDTCINIRNKFAETLEQAEQGFGITAAKEDKKAEMGTSYLDRKHNSNK
jgi:hypothetical protein